MKRIILLALTLSFMKSAYSQGITGTFTGLTNDTLWVVVSVLNDGYRLKRERIDTVVVRDGKFFYDPQTSNLTELGIFPLENIERFPNSPIMAWGGPGERLSLLYFPGNDIRMDANIEDKVVAFQAKGNRYNEQLSTLNAETQDAFKLRKDVLKVLSDRFYVGDKTVYQAQLREAMQVINNNELNYICKNPDDPFSAYLVASWSVQFSDKILQYTDSLGVTAKSSEFGRVLRQKIEDIYKIRDSREENKKKEIEKKEMIGKPAPEFTLKDINRNDFSLSSLRGKYIVLNFWGSWCGWSLSYFPDIKKYYTAHPDEFEIVGIAFSDEPEKWRKVVLEKPSLPWINVFDENDLHDKYYVFAAPTYVLVDKEGIIVDFPSSHHEVIKQLNMLREKGLL